MRRKDREITDEESILKIVEKCSTCHVAMIDESNANFPYVIPLSFGFTLQECVLELYFHCAKLGKKLDCLKKNSKVAFSMCYEGEIEIFENDLCESSRFYESVVGQGEVKFIESPEEKCKALSLLMKHQAACANVEKKDFEFSSEMVYSVMVFKITSNHFSGKAKLARK